MGPAMLWGAHCCALLLIPGKKWILTDTAHAAVAAGIPNVSGIKESAV